MMDTRRNGLILLALLLLTRTTIHAQTDSMGKDLPVDSVSIVTSDSLQAKRSFFKKFLDYFNDANKEKKNKNSISVSLVVLIIPVTQSLGLDWWQQVCIAQTAMIRFFLLRMFLFMEMSLLLDSTCWV